MHNSFTEMTKRLQFLEEENKHLKACLEENTRIQHNILVEGMKLLDVPDNTTVTVDMAWNAILTKLN